jgi:hypothetical protein
MLIGAGSEQNYAAPFLFFAGITASGAAVY